MSVTAKVKVESSVPAGDDQTSVTLRANYEDGQNKEWAKYTPSLSVMITVKNEVAHHFPVGQPMTLTFTPE